MIARHAGVYTDCGPQDVSGVRSGWRRWAIALRCGRRFLWGDRLPGCAVARIQPSCRPRIAPSWNLRTL